MLSTYVKSQNTVNISDLRRKKEEKDRRSVTRFDSVLQRCHVKIKSTADKAKDCVFYTVPLFEIDKPPITNVKACMAYLIYNLKKDGFDVTYIFPNMLWISWGDTTRQPQVHEPRPKSPKKCMPVTVEEKVMAIDKAISRPLPKQDKHFSGGGIYDDIFPSLKEGAERMKRKKAF